MTVCKEESFSLEDSAERGVSNNCGSKHGDCCCRWTTLKIGFGEFRYLGVDLGNKPKRVIGNERVFPGLSVDRKVITQKGLMVLPDGVEVGAVLPREQE
ncbi:hypothetical protein CDAR_518271 [Caerostris darwini]|uniref:Uncharacterized protein n=1 Tax=Caerostris darwini TaxID=1538125 RepID=A0AAV4RR26_9ARAC|nr:hypothetical protein CDAR_518271 [Caerostris darwini]